MTISDFLTESSWRSGSYALDANDFPCSPTSDHAAKWGLFGACCRAAGGYHRTVEFERIANAVRSACRELSGDADFEAWEKTADWSQVERLIRRAEELLS